MNSKPVDTLDSGESLNLPEPDPDNITVLTRNLPNTPILPWNHYDSPWALGEAAHSEQDADNSEQSTGNLEQNTENQEQSETAIAELDGELDPAVATTEVVAEFDGELDKAATTEVVAEFDGELDKAATTEVVAELDGNESDRVEQALESKSQPTN